MPVEEAYKSLGYKDLTALEEGWRAAQGYDAFDAEKFNKRILSFLNTIDAELAPPEGTYICPFCDKVSFRYHERGEGVFLTCSSCGSTVTLNDEVWSDPRKRIEFLSLTSGYPGTYILHHFIALHRSESARPGRSQAENPEIEKAVQMLSSPDENARYGAARYLRLRRPPAAFEPAAAAFTSEPVARIRLMLVQALPALGGSDAIPCLISAVGDADPAIRSAALQALSSFEGADVDAVIRHAASEDPDAGVRTLAAHIVGTERH